MVEANLEQCSVRATWRTPRKEIIGEVGPMSGVANNGDGDQPLLNRICLPKGAKGAPFLPFLEWIVRHESPMFLLNHFMPAQNF